MDKYLTAEQARQASNSVLNGNGLTQQEQNIANQFFENIRTKTQLGLSESDCLCTDNCSTDRLNEFFSQLGYTVTPSVTNGHSFMSLEW